MATLTTFEPFFRDFERLTDTLRPRRSSTSMPVDAYRHGDEFVVRFDLPGVDPESVDVTVEKNVLSVTAERRWAPVAGDEVLIAERPQGRYARQLFLSDTIDTERIDAAYEQGVLTLRIPVSVKAKPRRIQVSTVATPATATATPATPAPEVAAEADAAQSN